MSQRRLIPEFPLLRRELTELAQHKRTYILRCVGAVVLLAIAMYVYSLASYDALRFSQQYAQQFGRNPGAALQQFGIGGRVFEGMVPCLFWTINLLMPALCCAAITSEKEKNTLGNLFLTRLSPTGLLAEKMMSRLVPMLTLLFLTFPILAFVYSLGGVDTTMLVCSLWLLLGECLLFASIGIMCSAWFPTTVSAFVWSYTIVGFMLILTHSVGIGIYTPQSVWQQLQYLDAGMTFIPGFTPRAAGGSLGVTFLGLDVEKVVWTLRNSLPAVAMTLAFFALGRLFLVRRAFVSSSSFLLRLFRSVDAFFVRLNNATTSGIEIIPDRNVLPGDDAVAWRERTKKSLGKARYLFRILVLMEGPTLFICVLAAMASSAFSGLRTLLTILWAMTGIIICVKGAILISSEFARETIAPLLSTPMSSSEILRQKVVGMRRLLLVLAVPILSVNATMLMLHFDVSGASRSVMFSIIQRVLSYGVGSVLAVTLVMHVYAWLSALVGMRFRRQTRSILIALVAAGVLTMGPIAIDLANGGYFFLSSGQFATPTVGYLSPATLIVSVEMWLISAAPMNFYWRIRGGSMADFTPESMLFSVVVSFVIQGTLLFLLRSAAKRFASRFLQRCEQREQPSPVPQPTQEARFAT